MVFESLVVQKGVTGWIPGSKKCMISIGVSYF